MSDFRYACSQTNFTAFFHLSDFSLPDWTASLHWVHVEMTLFFSIIMWTFSSKAKKNITVNSFCSDCAAFATNVLVLDKTLNRTDKANLCWVSLIYFRHSSKDSAH